jgi:hypothetical protein
MFYRVRSVETGAESRLWVDHLGICSSTGDSCAPAYIHSELFGGMGRVVAVDAGAPQELLDYLAAPPRPDGREFGRCGSY